MESTMYNIIQMYVHTHQVAQIHLFQRQIILSTLLNNCRDYKKIMILLNKRNIFKRICRYQSVSACFLSFLKARMFKCGKVQESVAKTNRFALSLKLSLPAFPLLSLSRPSDLYAHIKRVSFERRFLRSFVTFLFLLHQ